VLVDGHKLIVYGGETGVTIRDNVACIDTGTCCSLLTYVSEESVNARMRVLQAWLALLTRVMNVMGGGERRLGALPPTSADMVKVWDERDETGDVEFVLPSGASVIAHRVVLASLSHYFRDLFGRQAPSRVVRSCTLDWR
jgi:hypothetical protein